MSAKRNVEDMYPLSPTQQGILFHSLADPGVGAYFEQFHFRVESLDAPAFRRAWRQTVERHAVLRTSVIGTGRDQPVQIVNRHVEPPLEELDWRDVTEDEAAERLEQFVEANAARGFDLSDPCLFRLTLIHLGGGRCELVWAFHHIILDGWSLALVISEVFQFYQAYSEGRQLNLPRPRRYRDFIAWLHRQDAAQEEAYWRETLAGFTAPTRIGLAHVSSRSAHKIESYGARQLRIPPETVAAAQALCTRLEITLSTLVQGVWALLLSRYSGEQDVVFGSVVSGRPPELQGMEWMVGLFINTLPLRTQVSPAASVSSWLQALQDQQLRMRVYEHTPLVDLQQWSQVPRGQPLFESVVAFENYPVDLGSLGALAYSNVRVAATISRIGYPLALIVNPFGELLLRLTYDGGRFTPETIDRALGHYRVLLEGMLSDPNRRLADIPLITEDERRQLLVDWNATAVDYRETGGLHELFEQQVERAPGAPAVVYNDEGLTYDELNRRANRLAHGLQALGVGPDCLVGVHLQRSLGMVVGLLGILKAGGAYVPIDPDYPVERQRFMLADSQAVCLLTDAPPDKELSAAGIEIIRLSPDGESFAGYGETNPHSGATYDNLAYVIYTSGTTGQPKGAMISHRGICNRLLWMQDAYRLDGSDRVLQKTPLSFDVSVWELFWPLITGATLVVAQPGGHRDGRYLVNTIRTQRITTIHFVPSMLALFLQTEDVQSCRALRRVICSGEALSLELQNKFFERMDVPLHNLYGPTEASVDVTAWRCDRNRGAVPIGKPISNSRTYVLDDQLQPVPVGVPGELYLSGVGLARGYHNRPSLTAEKFVPNPYDFEPGSRMYKTGDVCRWLSDGTIDYLGRVDHQLKIRGFRIELAEIESALTRHPQVSEAVVQAVGTSADSAQLAAYYVAASQQDTATDELRGFLRRRLPQHMVPSAFVRLDAMPLTPNGKVDRRALPEVDGESRISKNYVPPATDTEREVADVWQDVLQITRAGRNDNFFDLGGHSLSATQVVSRLENRFSIELALLDVFEHPTLMELASLVQTRSREPGGTRTSRITRADQAVETSLVDNLEDGQVASLLAELLQDEEEH